MRRSYYAWCPVLLVMLAACSEEPTVTEPSPANDTEATLARGSEDGNIDSDAIHHFGGGLPFADSEIFLEFNSTDNDLGVQIFLDGEDWKRVAIFNPRKRRILDIQGKREFKELGITELRFESAEPSPGEVLALFEPGTYRFVGRMVEGGRLTGMGALSHDLPQAPVFSPSNHEKVDLNNAVITWDPVPGVESYEVIVADEGESGLSMSVELPEDVNSLQVPPSFLSPDTEYKVEVLAIAENGNKTITEGFFNTLP